MMSAGRFRGKESRKAFGSPIHSALRLIVNRFAVTAKMYEPSTPDRIPDSTIFVLKQNT